MTSFEDRCWRLRLYSSIMFLFLLWLLVIMIFLLFFLFLPRLFLLYISSVLGAPYTFNDILITYKRKKCLAVGKRDLVVVRNVKPDGEFLFALCRQSGVGVVMLSIM